ncbi:MAG: response regulator [Opitutus sp.]
MTPERSILVIDDNAQLREVLRDGLKKLGYVVITASDGAEAFQSIARNKFDIVITDLLMPQKDGIEVIGELKRIQPAARIIAMSGGGRGSRDHYLQTARGLGAHAILGKPFSMSELNAALAAVSAPDPADSGGVS